VGRGEGKGDVLTLLCPPHGRGAARALPGVKFTIGLPIDQGFYYDVDLGDQTLSADELEAIEEKMLELARRDAEYERREVSKENAIRCYE